MIRELKTFLAVVRHGTFAGAGAQIGLTPSAVSAQIQRLEEELGFARFDRTARSAKLNAAGRQAVEDAEAVLSVYKRLAGGQDASQRSGLLRVGAIASAQASIMVGAIEQFRHEAPSWAIRIVPGVSLNLLGQVDSGELDAAILIEPPFALPSELRWRTLLTEPYHLLVPRKLAGESWKEIMQNEPFIRYDRNSFGGRQVDRFLKNQRITVRDTVELDELQAIVGLVAHGLGVAIVPRAKALVLPKTICGMPLDAQFVRKIGLVEHNQQQKAAAKQFGDAICAAAQRLR